jgi:glutaredoxin
MGNSTHSTASARVQRGSLGPSFLVAYMVLAALAFGTSSVGAEDGSVFYKYTDNAGRLHLVQSLDRVPTRYRNQIGEIALEGEPLWTKSTAQTPVTRPRVEPRPIERPVYGRNLDVVLYYADWCGYCKKARRWLDERNVDYELRDIDEPRYGQELTEVSGGKSVPVLRVGGDIIRGFKPRAYERALGG